jgi:hypothetical protein
MYAQAANLYPERTSVFASFSRVDNPIDYQEHRLAITELDKEGYIRNAGILASL